MVRGKEPKDRPIFISAGAGQMGRALLAKQASTTRPLFVRYSGSETSRFIR